MDTGFKAKQLGEFGYPPERVILTTTGDIYKATDDNEFELSSDGNVKFSEINISLSISKSVPLALIFLKSNLKSSIVLSLLASYHASKLELAIVVK